MKKLNLFNQVPVIEERFLDMQSKFYDFIIDAYDEISFFERKKSESVAKSLVKNTDIDITEAKEIVRDVFNLEEMAALPSYSPYNTFVWLRLADRKRKQLSREFYDYKEQLQKILQEVKNIEQELKSVKLKKRQQQRLDTLQGIRRLAKSLLEYELLDKSEILIETLFLTFYGKKKMPKNYFLSLITINHDLHHWDGPKNETMKYIEELPEEIDYETFRDAVFVYKLEHDKDCYLFDIIFEEMMKTLHENRELSEKSFDKFQEIFGPIPTYTAVTDEYGEVVSVTPNKPKLQIVK